MRVMDIKGLEFSGVRVPSGSWCLVSERRLVGEARMGPRKDTGLRARGCGLPSHPGGSPRRPQSLGARPLPLLLLLRLPAWAKAPRWVLVVDACV